MTLATLRSRATDPEQLDAGVEEAEALRSLRDLRFVNRWLSPPRGVLQAIRVHLPPQSRLLDVGSASGDLPAYLLSQLPGPIVAVGLDLKRLHFRYAPLAIRRVVADVRALPFPDRSFDVVTASLFMHHFDADVLPAVLGDLFRLARRALVVTDLERAALPYLFGRAFFPLLFKSRVSVEDGLVSIRRGFRKHELVAAFEKGGLPSPRVTWHFPFRLLAIAVRDGRPAPGASL